MLHNSTALGWSPMVSVILPVFNAAPYLRSAIDSILGQTYDNFELIIINDGSTDDSEPIISSYTDHRIIQITNPSNLGLVYSLNIGINSAKGEYIARMDADDISQPDRLSTQVAFLSTNPDYGMCGTFYEVIDNLGNKVHKVNLPETDRDLRTYLNFGNCFCHSTVMFRTDLTKRYRYEQERFLIEDYQLWYNISKECKIRILPVYTLLYRVHDDNISTRKREQMLIRLKEMNEVILRDLRIDFSESELNVHTHFLAFNHQYFMRKENMAALKYWILRAFHLLKDDSRYNVRLMTRIFLRRWFVICFKTKNYRELFFSTLLFSFKFSYFPLLIEKLTNSLAKKNLGIDY